MTSTPTHRIYEELSTWWPLLSPPEEYEFEAGLYERELLAAARRPLRTLLELGSGGGNNASFLKRRFEMTLVDVAAGMLDVSRRLNPECEHSLGDMRTVRLGRDFDGVFVHDAVTYMTSEDDLRRAMQTAFVHCRPGGPVLFAPDYVRENYRSGSSTGGHDGAQEGLRYLEWSWDPDPSDSTYVVHYAILLRHRDGSVQVVHDDHVEGLFPRQRWLDLMKETGFADVRAIPVEHPDVEPGKHELIVGMRPGPPA